MKRRYSVERTQIIDQISQNITDPERAKQAIEAVKEAKNREGIRKTLTKVDPKAKQVEVHKKMSRKSNYAIPLHLRHEKISTVAELALASTRWQKEMNTRMDDLDDFMCDTRDTLIEITNALKNIDTMMRVRLVTALRSSERGRAHVPKRTLISAPMFFAGIGDTGKGRVAHAPRVPSFSHCPINKPPPRSKACKASTTASTTL